MGVRWPSSSRVYLGVSLGLAVAAGLVVRSTLASATASGDGGQAGPMVDVVVAATPLSRGEPLPAEGLALAALPQAYTPPGAFRRIEQATGRVALSDLAAGEVVTQTRLARVRAGPVASLVPEGLGPSPYRPPCPRDRSRRATASTSWPRSARASPTQRPSSRAWRCCWSSARRPRQVRTTGYRSTPRRRASGPRAC